jgi:type IV secretion system protein VirD4
MKNYVLLWVVLTILATVLLVLVLNGWSGFAVPGIVIVFIASIVTAIIIANEIRRPVPQEYYRKKALYPKIDDKFLFDTPPSGSIIFGKDIHTKKIVASTPGGHVFVIGGTGSGKTAGSLLPSILNYDGTGSLQIIDIKSRELSYKSADINDPSTQIVDLNLRKPYVYGWDLLYKLKKDGTDTEQAVLDVVKEIAYVIVPKTKASNAFWDDAARNEFIGLFLYEYIYGEKREFIDIVKSIMNTPLQEHLEGALNGSPRDSLVASYLTSLASSAEETLFSVDLTLSQSLYPFVSEDAVYFFRDNPKRANPTALHRNGVKQYLCVDEHKLDSGYDRFINILMKQTLQELQSRTTSGTYAPCTMIYDEWARLSQSVPEIREVTASFLMTGRSKHASVVLCAQNLDCFDKQQILNILSNINFTYVLNSNNPQSFTSEVVTKMAGTYYEKERSHSESKGTSITTSFREKQIIKAEDLNCLGSDAILIITNYGYARTNKAATFYFKAEPWKSKYEKILAANEVVMEGA